MYYYLILAFQGFCIYHAYKNRKEYYWYFLIIFLPLIGCLIYLFTQVFSKSDVDKAQQELTHLVDPGKRIRDLERRMKFTDTFENRVALADAYLLTERYDEAIGLYEKSLDGMFKNDYYTISKLVEAYFRKGDVEKTLEYAGRIKNASEFKKSRSQFYYGLALNEADRWEEAEEQLRQTDLRYSNYEERITFADLLKQRGKLKDALEIYKEIISEGEYMKPENRRKNRLFIQRAREQYQALS
ncbi:tetratricopeptide repeat protein [Leptobacterium flavescens]|uniref:Tetratricopeptide repeat protein n=1 Tax=Leptobacterium flavescens TaxID=472055 RepID=A0A6P0UGI5_9FLAO|nr:tetratricopeptide repeat protein [Leptobacterium flavescens]NER12345.1 tetratricopeptide repeat protein [Leptobacterium flavescens]